MSREETVLLVSRALAVLHAVYALMDLSYVPQYLFLAHHYTAPRNLILPGESYMETIHHMDLASLLARVVGLSVLTWLFWRCGPWLAGLFCPARQAESSPAG